MTASSLDKQVSLSSFNLQEEKKKTKQLCHRKKEGNSAPGRKTKCQSFWHKLQVGVTFSVKKAGYLNMILNGAEIFVLLDLYSSTRIANA